MRLFTFQDYAVYDKIYYQKESVVGGARTQRNRRIQEMYDVVADRIKTRLGIPMDKEINPIWCWVLPKKEVIDTELLDELYDRMRPSCDSVSWFDMEVDNSFVMTLNADIWKDMLFKITFMPDYDIHEDCDSLFIKQKGATLMAAIPFINVSFIKNSMAMNGMSLDITQTDEQIAKDMEDGRIILVKDGEFAGIGIEEYN